MAKTPAMTELDEEQIQELLLKRVRLRNQKRTEFGYGISTADRFVKTIQECVGTEACYKFTAKKQTSFNDILRKAAKTLVYSNADMELEEKLVESGANISSKFDGLVLPKNTLMVFRHVLTTPRKDRDGDILRTQGALPDPKMLLLWQHVHTLPIGKMLQIHEHTSKKLSVISCIIDMNELCHDSAVMVDNGMGRFSHGFRALQFSEMKAEESEPTDDGGGFDVKRFEIMEESLVSVPSNADAETQEIILDLVEGGKLHSPMMKTIGKEIRNKRSTRIPVTVDLNLKINGKEISSEEQPGTKSKACKAGCKCGASKEADAADDKASDSDDKEMKPKPDEDVATCPKCDKPLDANGKCKCGYEAKESDKDDEESEDDDDEKMADNINNDMTDPHGECPKCGKDLDIQGRCACGYHQPGKSAKGNGEIWLRTKAGRVLSKANENAIKEAMDLLNDMEDYDGLPRPCKSMCRDVKRSLKAVLDSLGADDEPVDEKTEKSEMTVEEAMAMVISKSTPEQRSKVVSILKTMQQSDEDLQLLSQFRALTGTN
jgi:hypothetical protein